MGLVAAWVIGLGVVYTVFGCREGIKHEANNAANHVTTTLIKEGEKYK